jgi:anthranilate/para-aminobenzoate synthase component II
MLIVDNLSPFTPDIMESLEMLDISFACKKFSEVSVTDLGPVNRVILSGRRKNSKEINIVNSNIVRHCYRSGKPLLGICYGAEIVALTFGGSIRRLSDRIQGTTVISVSAPNPLTGTKSHFRCTKVMDIALQGCLDILARWPPHRTASMRYSPEATFLGLSSIQKRAEATAFRFCGTLLKHNKDFIYLKDSVQPWNRGVNICSTCRL